MLVPRKDRSHNQPPPERLRPRHETSCKHRRHSPGERTQTAGRASSQFRPTRKGPQKVRPATSPARMAPPGQSQVDGAGLKTKTTWREY